MTNNLDSSNSFIVGKDGERCLDPQLWHACAGGMVQMHKVNTKVYYFPQGHAEHAGGSFELPPSLKMPPFIPCKIGDVKFLADRETDEVFVKLKLFPLSPMVDGFGGAEEEDSFSENSGLDVDKPTSFAKTLTQSDANNGGGFSVPRYCAETIFPKLDYSNDPPVQTVLAKDVHGEVWKFRHIYRGTPRRHLLTTGWSTFVNQKKLVAGDSIVFLRTANGELCVGVRRSARLTGDSPSSVASAWCLSAGSLGSPFRSPRWEGKSGTGVAGGSGFSMFLREDENRMTRPGNNGGFSRDKTKVSAKAVIEACSLAAAGQPFEVIYFPRASTPEFCVKASTVSASMRVHWTPGMRFKMAFETEDSSRISWFMGTISSVQFADSVNWPNSPWRLLQVTWDEPDLLQNVKRVSPWLIEIVSNIPTIQMSPFALPKKKLRVSQHPEFQHDVQGIIGSLPAGVLPGNMLGSINPWQRLPENVPSGIQGARHGHFGVSLSDFCPNKFRPGFLSDNMYHCQEQALRSSPVSTELFIGNSSSLERSIGQGSISCILSSCDPLLSSKRSLDAGHVKPAEKAAQIRLFGQSIGMKEPEKSDSTQLNSQVYSTDGLGSSVITNNSGIVSGSTENFNTAHVDKINFSRSQGKGPHYHKHLDAPSAPNILPGISLLKEKPSDLGLQKCVYGDKLFDEGANGHCKVFMESEDVGRSLDLSSFTSFDELYKTLAQMFAVDQTDMLSRVLYRDANGIVRHTGDEPYSEFMKTARRVTILSDAGSDNMGR
ncbi:auxin response factor 10-like [Nymphaea colorata]|nr:auxin response factor 10-like [Nymphaea colorata]